jgi:hypothetical protein
VRSANLSLMSVPWSAGRYHIGLVHVSSIDR